MICVFDLGNVMVFHFLERCFAKLATVCRAGAPVEELFYAAFDAADVGRGGDFETIHPVLAVTAGLTLSPEELRQTWNDVFEPNPPMVAFVRRLPRPRVLLSNTNEPHATWINAQFPEVFPLFDHLVLSHEVGAAKPEPAIFRRVEARTGASPERHIFIDDLEENVAAARALGWQGIVFTGVADCRKQLAARGVKEIDASS